MLKEWAENLCGSVWIERGLRKEMTSLEPPGGGGHANHGFNEDDGVRILIANHRHRFRTSRLDEIVCKNVKIK